MSLVALNATKECTLYTIKLSQTFIYGGAHTIKRATVRNILYATTRLTLQQLVELAFLYLSRGYSVRFTNTNLSKKTVCHYYLILSSMSKIAVSWEKSHLKKLHNFLLLKLMNRCLAISARA
eukprot:TRINITY_DN4385_c0_g3_i1.p3 TRINITY_DN4385_c0_g3~~TRINITY_DN4385_c0_g3_i1.p3  ORF type:complete len:122 (+),score=4.40 TRINITY_DN4385_c0_g3_i1:150-515(+)